MAKQQGKLTLFLTSSSSVDERALIDEECAADLQPATKRTKHRESGFDHSWQEEFAWVLVDEDKDGQKCTVLSAANTIKQPNGWYGLKYPAVFFERTNSFSINGPSVTWTLSSLSPMQLLQGLRGVLDQLYRSRFLCSARL